MAESTQPAAEPALPRVTIQFCTQCKWMLRAAYVNETPSRLSLIPSLPLSLSLCLTLPPTNQLALICHVFFCSFPPAQYAQELLSTFSTSLGEVALQPATGGVFVVEITTPAVAADDGTPGAAAPQVRRRRVLWDRKTDGGFPETKELKRRVRDVIQPGRDLGHVDRDYGRKKKEGEEEGEEEEVAKTGEGDSKACGVEEGGKKCEDCQ